MEEPSIEENYRIPGEDLDPSRTTKRSTDASETLSGDNEDGLQKYTYLHNWRRTECDFQSTRDSLD